MVEFGLKLKDNQVEDWAEHYIHYDKLKAILKRLKAQLKRYKDLAGKDQEMGKRLMEAYRDGAMSTTGSPSASIENFQVASPSATDVSPLPASPMQPPLNITTTTTTSSFPLTRITEESERAVAKENTSATSETTKLLEASAQQDKNSSYGSGKSLGSNLTSNSPKKSGEMQREGSDGSLDKKFARAFFRATSGVQGYFSYSLERQFRDTLLQIDKSSMEFEVLLTQDIDAVNDFYNSQLSELEDRLVFLKESVASTNRKARPRSRSGGSDLEEESDGNAVFTTSEQMESDISAPLIPAHRRTTSPMELAKSLASRFPRFSMAGAMEKTRSNSFSPPVGPSARASTSHIDLNHEDESEDQFATEDEETKEKRIREAESIQRAIVDQYRTAKLLHNYAIMNYTGFVKIVKKHDKTNPDEKHRFKRTIQPDQICDEGKAVEQHAAQLERYYATWFCGGNISEARAQMLPKKGDSLQMDWSQLRLGYRLGMCTILGLWVCWDCIWGLISEQSSTIGERTAFPVFRACGGLLTLQWFWGMSTWIWSRYRINYIYLFDFDPRVVDGPLAIFNSAVDNTLAYLTCMLLYYKAGVHDIPGEDIPAGLFPFILVMYTLLQLVLPLRTRVPMWISIWKVISAPLTSPSFYHGYVGDIFTSMVKVFQDLAWTFCFIFSGDWLIPEDSHHHSSKLHWTESFAYKHVAIPLLTLLPLWFRFNQCLRRYADSGDRFPHLANAFKYALSQTVTLFGAFHPLYLDLNRNRESDLFQGFWMFAFIGSSLYSFAWDVYMDWGLGKLKFGFLSQRLMYPRKGMYYAIISLDLVLRFAWVLTLIPPGTGAKFALPPYLTAVSMVLELYRRTVWGLLRLEHEHKSNTEGYRRVGFVPLHFSTGHAHKYKEDKDRRGYSVLLEVAIITLIVVGISFGSVVAAQRATERANGSLGEL